MSEFFQDPPELQNTFTHHRWLRAYLRFKLPKHMVGPIEEDLTQLGTRCAFEYMELARQAEREKPVLVPYEAWGRRVDQIRVSAAWTALKAISAREGLIAIGYKRDQAEFSRLYQFAKLYLFHPSSAFFTCPLAMADGAAKVLELSGTLSEHREAFARLTSRDPERFWTSGQWMTERTGGSDVSRTSTEVRFEGPQARLYGVKWFSSSTTSEMALALARLPDSVPGSRGLTLFWVPTYLAPGHLNHIRILRLKDKLGTWALPTAELQLEGSLAYQIGEKDQGIKTVANMLNITRLYNSVCSIGQTTRALEQMRDYSNKREAFGARLSDHILHYSTFAQEEVKLLAGFLLTMELVHLLGRDECGAATGEERDVLRLFTPICKLFTARAAVQTASEVVEGFGGAGYIEDTGIPVHLRDSQVFSIWEGATNVLSLDVLRVLQKSEAMESVGRVAMEKLKSVRSPSLQRWRDDLMARWTDLASKLTAQTQSGPELLVASCRDLAFHLAWLFAATLLVDWAEKETGRNQKVLVAHLAVVMAQLQSWTPRSQQLNSALQEIWQGLLED
ncbi:MAG: acyl-CoA dehydrogenase family protein [Bdellovibrionales bacterium]